METLLVEDFGNFTGQITKEDDGLYRILIVKKLGKTSKARTKIILDKRGTTYENAFVFYTKEKHLLKTAEEERNLKKLFDASNKRDQVAEALENIAIGDVYVHTFGYSMTINRFYEVVGFKGRKVVVVKVDTKTVNGAPGQQGHEVAIPLSDHDYTPDLLVSTVLDKNTIRLAGSRDRAYKSAPGKEHFFSYND